jgi:hypothetical protein
LFKRDDFVRYFEQVSGIEQKMLENMDFLLGQVQDPQMLESIKRIRQDEIKHVRLLKKVGSIVERMEGGK